MTKDHNINSSLFWQDSSGPVHFPITFFHIYPLSRLPAMAYTFITSSLGHGNSSSIQQAWTEHTALGQAASSVVGLLLLLLLSHFSCVRLCVTPIDGRDEQNVVPVLMELPDSGEDEPLGHNCHCPPQIPFSTSNRISALYNSIWLPSQDMFPHLPWACLLLFSHYVQLFCNPVDCSPLGSSVHGLL